MRCTIHYAGVPIGAVTLRPNTVSPQLLAVEPLPGATALAAPIAKARDGPVAEPPDLERRKAWLSAAVGFAGVVGLARDWAATAALADALELRDAFGVLIPTEHLDLVVAPDDARPLAAAVHLRATPAPVPARHAPLPRQGGARGAGAGDLT